MSVAPQDFGVVPDLQAQVEDRLTTALTPTISVIPIANYSVISRIAVTTDDDCRDPWM